MHAHIKARMHARINAHMHARTHKRAHARTLERKLIRTHKRTHERMHESTRARTKALSNRHFTQQFTVECVFYQKIFRFPEKLDLIPPGFVGMHECKFVYRWFWLVHKIVPIVCMIYLLIPSPLAIKNIRDVYRPIYRTLQCLVLPIL